MRTELSQPRTKRRPYKDAASTCGPTAMAQDTCPDLRRNARAVEMTANRGKLRDRRGGTRTIHWQKKVR
jgi:hypothetical protein